MGTQCVRLAPWGVALLLVILVVVVGVSAQRRVATAAEREALHRTLRRLADRGAYAALRDARWNFSGTGGRLGMSEQPDRGNTESGVSIPLETREARGSDRAQLLIEVRDLAGGGKRIISTASSGDQEVSVETYWYPPVVD